MTELENKFNESINLLIKNFNSLAAFYLDNYKYSSLSNDSAVMARLLSKYHDLKFSNKITQSVIDDINHNCAVISEMFHTAYDSQAVRPM